MVESGIELGTGSLGANVVNHYTKPENYGDSRCDSVLKAVSRSETSIINICLRNYGGSGMSPDPPIM